MHKQVNKTILYAITPNLSSIYVKLALDNTAKQSPFFTASDLEYTYLKELITAYFSFKFDNTNYYCWPNNINKHSAIKDFFESFYLININEIKIPL